jgi:cobalt/nickel transport system ATP-binding protein
MSTHDLNLVYRWADWLFVIDKGRLVLEGKPQDVFAQREIMEELQLGVPLVFEMLSEMSDVIQSDALKAKEKTGLIVAEQLRERILQLLQKFCL